MRESIDPRARGAAICAIAASALVVVNLAITIPFATFGVILAGASVVAVDEPATARTRRCALVAGGVSLLIATVVLVLLFSGRLVTSHD